MRPTSRALEAGAFALACAACSTSQETSAPPIDASAALASACSAPNALHAATISDFVASLQHGYAYTELSIDQMNAVTAATRALAEGDLPTARLQAQKAGYGVAPLVTGGGCYVLLQPTDAAPPGQATLVYASSWDRELVIEAPHVPEDHRSDAEAALLFVQLRARATVIAGAHRCAVPMPSGCRFSTECNPMGTAIASDLAHSVLNALNAMHLFFRTTDAVVLQVHTNFRPDVNGDALVSNGTTYVIPGTVANAVYAALQAPDLDVRSCNDARSPPVPGAFCGEANTQGLASNGAADQCLGRAPHSGDAAAHRFVHLEQNTNRMDALDTWSPRVAAALAAAIPPAH